MTDVEFYVFIGVTVVFGACAYIAMLPHSERSNLSEGEKAMANQRKWFTQEGIVEGMADSGALMKAIEKTAPLLTIEQAQRRAQLNAEEIATIFGVGYKTQEWILEQLNKLIACKIRDSQ
jgi:hypothetical protein